MKDRNVQYPTRYRLAEVEGAGGVYDLESVPGEVTEEGTPVNKLTLLTDETAAAILANHPEAGHIDTVNEALMALSAGGVGGGLVVQDSPPDKHDLGWVDTSAGGVLKYWDEASESWKPTLAVWG